MEKPTFHIITYGCPANQSDSERISAILQKRGWQKNPSAKKADLMVINACSIRQSAIDRIYGQLENLKRNKKQKIIVTGCLLDEDKKKMKKRSADIVETKDWAGKKPFFSVIPDYPQKFTACVPISSGCDNYCSYCVVPYTRGREKHRPEKEILAEVKGLVQNGCREIFLTGQNANSHPRLPELLKKIDKIPGRFWLRTTSNHPKDAGDKMIKAMTGCKKLSPYINLPVQSGDNAILKKMNRKYTVEKYKNIIEKTRRAIPDITLSTDVIVGFPGETKKQFKNTAALMKKIKYDMAYTAQYSPRRQTTAFRMKDNVPKKEKKRREAELTKILAKTAMGKNKKFIGQTVDVLVYSFLRGALHGKTWHYKNIKIERPKNISNDQIRKLIGQFVKARVTGATPWHLEGRLA